MRIDGAERVVQMFARSKIHLDGAKRDAVRSGKHANTPGTRCERTIAKLHRDLSPTVLINFFRCRVWLGFLNVTIPRMLHLAPYSVIHFDDEVLVRYQTG
jgi:hypothetical protein